VSCPSLQVNLSAYLPTASTSSNRIRSGISSGEIRRSPVHSSRQAAQGQDCLRNLTGYIPRCPSLQDIPNTPFSTHSISFGSSVERFVMWLCNSLFFLPSPIVLLSLNYTVNIKCSQETDYVLEGYLRNLAIKLLCAGGDSDTRKSTGGRCIPATNVTNASIAISHSRRICPEARRRGSSSGVNWEACARNAQLPGDIGKHWPWCLLAQGEQIIPPDLGENLPHSFPRVAPQTLHKSV